MSHRLSRPILIVTFLVPTTALLAQNSVTPQTSTPKIAFSAPQTLTLPPSNSNPNIIGLGDLNGDGNTDLLTSSGVLLGNGKGGFSASSVDVSNLVGGDAIIPAPLTDLNGDGKLDAIQLIPAIYDPNHCDDVDGQITLYTGNGKGGFTEGEAVDGGDWSGALVAIGDFNNDGKPDVVAIPSLYGCDPEDNVVTVDVMLNQGDGTFKTPVQYQAANADSRGLVLGDFNGDGNLDIAYTSTPARNENSYNYIQVLYGNGDGSFRTGPIYTFDSLALLFAAADLNGDKRSDILAYVGAKDAKGAEPRLAILLAKQTEGFYWSSAFSEPPQNCNIGEIPNESPLADFNGDGKLDLLFGCTTSNNESYIKILAGEGDAKFAAAQSFATFENPLNVTTIPLSKGKLPSIIFQSLVPNSNDTKYGVLINESN